MKRSVKRKADFPITVKAGSAVVKIYKRPSRGITYFGVAYYLGGKRKFLNFQDLDSAKAEAQIQAAKLARGDVDGAMLTGRDRLIYGRALEALRSVDITLDVAATQFAEAQQQLGGHSLGEAVRFFAKHHSERITSKTVTEVAEELIKSKRDAGLSAVYISDLKHRLKAFKARFQCPLNSVTQSDVREFLSKLEVSARSHNNFVRALVTLLQFAKARKYLSRDFDLMEGITRRKERNARVEIFTPEELSKILSQSTAELAACIALTAFAGLRSEEVLRLEWSDIARAPGFVEIGAAKAKTASRRLVPISTNLAAWLAAVPKASLKLWKHSKPFYFEALAKAACEAKVKWKQNGLRHSYISYRLAEVQDVGKVALEAGNSPQMIFRNYRELVTPEQAIAWFTLAPSSSKLGNVISIRAIGGT